MRVIQLDRDDLSLGNEWDRIITAAYQYDFYHLSSYHKIAEKRGEGTPTLFVHGESDRFIALPMLLREVRQIAGLESENFCDLTSVYGYAGPVCSHPHLPQSFIRSFQEELTKALRAMNVVSVFSRLHPLLPQENLLTGLGIVKKIGKTVVVDMNRPIELQRAEYRADHKRDINRLRREGWVSDSCVGLPCEGRPLKEFMRIYYETMDRVRANAYYYFDEEYVIQLLEMHGAEVRLFWVEFDGHIGAIGIFTLCAGIVQYHLSGTDSRFLKHAPMKLLLDEVRLWANGRGARYFHLGGGVGGREDALFEFKAGFSKEHRDFYVWNWIVNENAYERLCALRERVRPSTGVSDYFPAYRL